MMTVRDSRLRAAELREWLGNPYDADAYFSYGRRVSDDEHEVYPAEGFALLNRWGLQQYYVPSAFGGRLTHFETLGALLRVTSARDLTISISHAASFLGSMCVWIAGTAAQRNELATHVLSGKRISLALTEKSHGGDLLAAETSATPIDDGFRLDGEKWLINGISRNDVVTVFARTDSNGGARGFSLFLVNKESLPSTALQALPGNPTLGVRGADISGMRFNNVPLEKAALLGDVGCGFECLLKGLQLSRLLCGGLSLGAADTAMAVTLDFILQRTLYGKPACDIPQVRRLLTEAWAEMLIADSVTTLSLRFLQMMAGQGSIHSAVVKYLVPSLMEQTFQKLASVLGARYYLRSEHAGGIFQKALRDHLLIGLFDGSTLVNLSSLSFQLRVQLGDSGSVPKYWEKLLTSADLFAELPPFDWSGLALTCQGRDVMLAPLAAEPSPDVRAITRADGEWGSVQDLLREALLQAMTGLELRVRALPPRAWLAREPELFDLARQYTILCAAGATFMLRGVNRLALAGSLGHPAVWTIVLSRLAALAGAAVPALPSDVYTAAFAALRERYAADAGYGLDPLNTVQSGEDIHGCGLKGNTAVSDRRADLPLVAGKNS